MTMAGLGRAGDAGESVSAAGDPGLAAGAGSPSRPGSGLLGVGVVLVGTFSIIAILGPLLAPGSLGQPFERPSLTHLLGTDDLGRDLLGQLLAGARTSMAVGVVAATIATVVGSIVGLTAGFVGGLVDRSLSHGLDVALALPFVPLVIVIGAYVGPGPTTAAVVIGLLASAHSARVIRSQVLEARSRGPVEAAVAMGATFPWIARRHLLPIVTPLLVPQFVRAAATAVIVEASLSFLGLGDPTVPRWGVTIAFGQARGALLTGAWLWWVVPPGACIAAVVTGLALLGFGLEERAQPWLVRSGRGMRRPSEPNQRQTDVTRHRVGDSITADGRREPALLEVTDLTVGFASPHGTIRVVDGASFAVGPGEVIGLVGESGAGKSTIAMSILALMPPGARIERGSVRFAGRDVRTLSSRELAALRGDRIALVPQSAMHALDPVVDIHSQVVEVIRAHRRTSVPDARERANTLLELVGIATERRGAFPHELSGGMRQRVVIAIAIANDPALLIADEPTTGLDVVVADGIISVLADLHQRLGLSMVVISHDMATVLRLADRIVVLHNGRVIEAGPARRVAADPVHPRTRRLLADLPALPPLAAHEPADG